MPCDASRKTPAQTRPTVRTAANRQKKRVTHQPHDFDRLISNPVTLFSILPASAPPPAPLFSACAPGPAAGPPGTLVSSTRVSKVSAAGAVIAQNHILHQSAEFERRRLTLLAALPLARFRPRAPSLSASVLGTLPPSRPGSWCGCQSKHCRGCSRDYSSGLCLGPLCRLRGSYADSACPPGRPPLLLRSPPCSFSGSPCSAPAPPGPSFGSLSKCSHGCRRGPCPEACSETFCRRWFASR